MASVRSAAKLANFYKGNYARSALDELLGLGDTFGAAVLGNNNRETVRNVGVGMAVGGAIGAFFKWAAATAPVWRPLAGGAAVSTASASGSAGAAVAGDEVGAAALERATAEQAAGRTSGVAAELRVKGQTFTDVSTGGAPRTLDPKVQSGLEQIPEANRSLFHGECAEPGCISRAIQAGVDPRGGEMTAVRIRRPGNAAHGTLIDACPSCAALMDYFGIKY